MFDCFLGLGLVMYILFFVWIPVPGIQPLLVVSGSMEPEIKKEDIAYVRRCTSDELGIGDVVAYETGNGQMVLHRIVEMKEEGFVTKGDANEEEDFAIVGPEKVRGKLVAVLPHGGVWYRLASENRILFFMKVYLGCKGIIWFCLKMKNRIFR